MEARSLLLALCQRHGVDPARAERLLPLVRWALQGPEESKQRILEVVERALTGDPEAIAGNREELLEAADDAILLAVARVLHDWTPEQTVLDLGFLRGGEGAEGDESD